MKQVVLLASYQKYMIRALKEALENSVDEFELYDFDIGTNNELSYDTIYEIALRREPGYLISEIDVKQTSILEVAMAMMDRNEPFRNALDNKSKEIIITKVYDFWLKFLKDKKVSLVFFEEEPHQFFDYVLYLVATERELETAWFERTLPQSGLLLKRNNRYLKKTDYVEPKNFISIEGYMDTMRGTYDEVASLMYFDATDTLGRMNK